MKRFVDRRTVIQTAIASMSAIAAPAVHASCSEAGNYRIRRKSDFRSFDPIDVRGEDEVITRNIMAPLVRATQRRAGGSEWEFVPHLAQDFQRNDEATIFEMHLGTQEWSDGSAISPEDVVNAIARVSGLESGNSTPNSYRWDNLKDVSHSGNLRIELEQPDVQFMSSVLPWGAACVAQSAFASGFGSQSFGTNLPPTSGRYEVCELRPRERIQLAFDERWNGDRPKITAAEFVVIPDEAVAEAALAAGEIQAMRATPTVLFNAAGSAFDLLSRDGRLRVFDTPNSSVRYLAINSQRVQAPELRAAIQRAIDRGNVLDAVYGDLFGRETFGVVAESILPRHVFGASEELPLVFDPDEAQNLIRDVGPIDDVLTIGVAFPVHRPFANAIAEELRRIDLAAEVVDLEFGDVLSGRAQDEIDMLVQTNFVRSLDPSEAVEEFTSQGFPFGFESPEYDARAEELTFTFDASARFELVQSLQAIVLNEGAVLPLEDGRERWLTTGFTPTFMPDGSLGDIGDWEPEG